MENIELEILKKNNAPAIYSGLKIKLNFLVIFILITVLAFSGFQCTRQNRAKATNIIVWDLVNDAAGWPNMIASYMGAVAADQTKTPVKISYVQKVFTNEKDYEDELSKAISDGVGPDIITVNNSWLPRYKNKIFPLDGGVKTAQDYRGKFVDAVSNDFLEGNKIYAVPFSLDTLALYYNVDILNSVGIFDPPKTWDEFSDAVKKLTIRDEKGIVNQAGAAIGTDKNVDRSSDILSLLMMQNGSTIIDDSRMIATFNNAAGINAFQFYTDFADPAKIVYTWNPLMDNSIDAFCHGKAAMMINYAYNIPTVRDKAPKFKFAIAPVPQVTGVTVPVNYANYWAMTVSSSSAHPTEAWDFLMYITNPEINKIYLTKTALPTAQRDLASWQENGEDLNLSVFAVQSLTAKSWYQKDNFAVETIFNGAINSINLGRSTPQSASALAASQLEQLMK